LIVIGDENVQKEKGKERCSFRDEHSEIGEG
jgi:hypothetical protein